MPATRTPRQEAITNLVELHGFTSEEATLFLAAKDEVEKHSKAAQKWDEAAQRLMNAVCKRKFA